MLSDPAILDRAMNSKQGFPPGVAREFLKFAFPTEDLARYEKLSRKAQDDTLTKKERAELEDCLNVNDLLMILKAKAEISLRKKGSAA